MGEALHIGGRQCGLLNVGRERMFGIGFGKFACRVLRKHGEPHPDCVRQQRIECGQYGGNLRLQRLLQRRPQRGAIVGDEVAQPLLALAEHAGDKIDQPIGVVVHVLEQAPPRRSVCAGVVQLGACGLCVKRLGVLGRLRQCAQLRRQRRLTHQRHAQCVDRVHLQSRGVRDQAPAERRIAQEHRPREVAAR